MKDKKEIEEMILINKETGEKVLTFEPLEMKSIEPITSHDIIFLSKDNSEILRLKENGDILVKGKMIENDLEVVDGLREFLFSHGIR